MAKWKTNLLGAMLSAGLLGGCVAPATHETIAPGRDIALPLPITQAEVEARTARLAKKLEQTNLGEREKNVAMALLNSYQILGATLQPPVAEGDRQRVIRLLFEALSKMDEEYFLKESVDENAYSKIFGQYSSRRNEIIQSYLSGDHEKVVNQSIALRDLFGQEALTPDIALLSSISLAKLGRYREAISQGESVAKELERRPDLVNLRAYILEWQLAMGQERSAQESLKELALRVDEKDNVLQEAKKRMGVEEKVATPPETETVTPPAVTEGLPSGEKDSLGSSLAEVRGLIAKKEYTKAKFLLLQQRIRYPEGPEIEAIDKALQEVELAEGKGEQAPADQQTSETTQEAAQQAAGQKAVLEGERIVLAKKLIEEEKFEDALAKLNEPDVTASAEVNTIKEIATEKLINRERNRAAKLYLMAKSEGDSSKKEELLVSSFNILKGLLDKYPTSPLKKKINENMSTIKDEMGRMKRRGE